MPMLSSLTFEVRLAPTSSPINGSRSFDTIAKLEERWWFG